MKFWKDIFALKHPNLHFVFVSQWLVDSTEEDFGIKISPETYSIINNFIDGGIFSYTEKSASDRLNFLSIRPYAKLVYANDLTVSAILELSQRPYFDQLNFTLVGDGELFDSTVAPIKNFPNVTVKKQFLTHAEIAEYHRANGIFLVPTRMDTQGVSRDEAMSSGLVAITTNVAAIPEFVSNEVAMVVEPESPKAIADAVEKLYNNPTSYLELSKKGSENVAQKCGFEKTVQREIDLITEAI
ncbi:glycosyltransferase family 4 protein [Advenella mimigardefordensis]|uniref:glycosyltransferase family 4 protein n=1 Tax=Advenella mimigardefordensis TaxID=302406 RepID=UPI000694E5DD|nr:glycosyltransferase family 4 protein [Advenella mimigardefordensis]